VPDDPPLARAIGVLCLTAHPEPDLDRIRDRLRAGIDPRLLLCLAEVHGVRPQLIRCLAALSWEAVPDDVRSTLETFQHRHLLQTLNLAHELLRLVAQFAEHDIKCLAFKGPALALALYDGLADREYIDLDLMVDRGRMEKAERLLFAAGYRCPEGDRAFREAFLGWQRQYTFLRDGDGLLVDLHWDFKGRHVPFPLDPGAAWQDLGRLPLGDAEIATVSDANRALMLAGHGTKEAWRLLKWSGDFARAVHRGADLDWREIHRRAHGQGCGKALLLACTMAEQVVGVAVPPALADLAAQEHSVVAKARSLAGQLRSQLPSPAAPNFVDLGLCDDRLGRTRARLSLALVPTPGDYRALPLPRPLWPAYYLTRPFRLAANTVAAIGRKGTSRAMHP
jgi:hypothetical protein